MGKKVLPSLADVPFTYPTPPGNPKGVLSGPRPNTGAVTLCDLEDMIYFALSYDQWADPDYGISARGWAGDALRLIQIQSTPEQYPDLPDDAKGAIEYACLYARAFQPGDEAYLTMPGVTPSVGAANGYRVAPGVGALADDNHDPDDPTKVTWKGFRADDGTARKAFYEQMISDINIGAYLYNPPPKPPVQAPPPAAAQ